MKEPAHHTIGLVINPIAGMGGRAGVKGTDGPQSLEAALERGATPIASDRADRMLRRLHAQSPHLRVLTGGGALGEDVTSRYSFRTEVVVDPGPGPTTPSHTRQVANTALKENAELLIFAGGDGTARDVTESIGHRLPTLGIPSGVKMHSGVFASSPEAAAETANAFLCASGPRKAVTEREVVDVDVDEEGSALTGPRLHGHLAVPVEHSRMVGQKTWTGSHDAALRGLCQQVAQEMDDRTYVMGPGTTIQRILEELDIDGTPLGVDVIRGRRMIAKDASEQELLAVVPDSGAAIIAGVVGGQGFLFGRGNQQISPSVIRRVGTENIEVVAAGDKLAVLSPAWLRVDTGDPEIDELLSGYRKVRVAPNRTVVMKLTT